MIPKVASLSRNVFSLRWRRTHDGRTTTPAGQQQEQEQQQQKQEQEHQPETPEVSLVRLRLLELTGNGTFSPFHRCYAVVLLLSTLLALLLGGPIIGLPWLILSCWTMWGLRMISFYWGGIATFLDLLFLPSAVLAFQQRYRQKRVREEIRKRLRAALKGFDIAAFLGEGDAPESAHSNSADDRINTTATRSSSSNSSTDRINGCTRGGSSSSQAVQQLTNIPVESSHTGMSQEGKQGKHEQQNALKEIDDIDGKLDIAAEGSPNAVRRRSLRLLQMRQTALDTSSADSSKTATSKGKEIGGSAPAKTRQPRQQEEGCSSEQATHATLASVKEELQRADLLRQQRAAAAVKATAAANARRLGLSSLADCRRRAGKEALTQEDVVQLLEKAHVPPELLTFPDCTAVARRNKISHDGGSWFAKVCRISSSATSRSVNADSTSIPLPAPRATATAASSASDASVTSAFQLSTPTSGEKTRSAESHLSSTFCCSSRGDFRREDESLSAAATPCDSCPAPKTSHENADSNSSGSSNRSGSLTRVGGATSNASNAKEDSKVNRESTRSRQDGDQAVEGGAKDVLEKDVADNSRVDIRRKGWMSFVSLELIFRGLLAHTQCTYIVDLLFCHAQLSPLSTSIHRAFLLILHSLIRGLTVFLAFASSYTYLPYSSRLLDCRLLYCLCMCLAASFGATAYLLVSPAFIEGLLQPLLRFLLLPESIVKCKVLLLFVDISLMLPSVPLAYQRSTWSERSNFYAACQLLTFAVLAVGAYAFARAYEAISREAAAARSVYAKDVLTLLTLGDRDKRTAADGASGRGRIVSAGAAADVAGSTLVAGAQHSPETTAAATSPSAARIRNGERCMGGGVVHATMVSESREGSLVAKSVDNLCDRKSLHEKRASLREYVEPVSSSHEGKGGRSEQEQRQAEQDDLKKQQQQQGGDRNKHQQEGEEKNEMKDDDGRLSLLLAEKVIEERRYLTASDFELLRRRTVKRLLFFSATVVAAWLVLCWAIVAFLAVSNVAMRVNTPSDVLQERNNARLINALAAALAMFDDEETDTTDGFQDWAETIRLLQEEVRDAVNYYRKVQNEQGWVAATLELWKKIQEDFAAAKEDDTMQRKREMSAYAILGVKPSATGADIKKAYKILAKQLHPDILAASGKQATPEELNMATERMRQINAAYEKLIRKHGGRARKSS